MRKFTLVLTSIFVMGYILPMLSQANFSTSLHKTREGKNDAYETAAYPDSLANGDVHRKAGMTCITCHTKAEIHGDDGIAYALLKENGAIQTECMDCHSPLPTNSAHSTHSATVDCAACHAVSVLTCAGCHFETVVAIGKNRAINQIKGYRLLVKKNDKGHLGGFMTHSFQGEK